MTFLLLYTIYLHETQISKKGSSDVTHKRNQMRRVQEDLWKQNTKPKGNK